ncbi:MAG: DsrE family protein [Rubrivivax sp.]|nr:DsrE family protein [Rubrivivax sp.]
MFGRRSWLLWLLVLASPPPQAQTNAPWGGARETAVRYAPARVLYDIDRGGAAALGNILDRISLLDKLYAADPFEASIVVVIHGDAIPLFGTRDFAQYRDLMVRAQSLTHAGTIEFRMCRAAAGVRGYRPADIHGFVQMVPMADAEIVRLQKQGYAYMR